MTAVSLAATHHKRLTIPELKTVAFCNVLLCNVVYRYHCFTRTDCLHLHVQGTNLKVEAAVSSTKLVLTYHTAWHHIRKYQKFKTVKP